MTAGEIYRKLRDRLVEAGIADAGFEAGVLMEHVAGCSRFELDTLDEARQRQLEKLAQRRMAREPLQYIVGHWPFLNLELKVGPGVLIPRPETEEVCLVAAALMGQNTAPVVLDLCAGTGALGLGLKSRLPGAAVTLVELSEAAFGYLADNTRQFSRDYPQPPQPKAVRADVFEFCRELGNSTVDLIISNPPYVTEAEYTVLQPEISHEPRQALVARDEGLAFYKGIAAGYLEALRPGGWLVFEIGARQGAVVARILEENGYTAIDVRQDMADHDRMVLAQKPE